MMGSTEIQRHKTAIRRGDFSRPVKCLLRDGLLNKAVTFFDYGCGRGEDLELLAIEGVACGGWDPAYRSDGLQVEADVVNLGYIINVIEDPQERAETLCRAWGLSRQVLAVSAQVLMAGRGKEPVEFGDGVLTNRGTFQKFYDQNELKTYLEAQLHTEAIPAGIGTFYLFKDESRRQEFLATRFRRREILPRRRIAELRLEETRQALDPLMEVIASLGRLPDPTEFSGAAAVIDRFGSLKRAFAVIQRITDADVWESIARRRREDMLVYLALARRVAPIRRCRLFDEPCESSETSGLERMCFVSSAADLVVVVPANCNRDGRLEGVSRGHRGRRAPSRPGVIVARVFFVSPACRCLPAAAQRVARAPPE